MIPWSLTLLLACGGPDAEPSGVVLISVDTLRADHLGAYGDPRGLTPNIDALMADGVRYTNAHAHAPWTKPSVATLMTSQLPWEHGLHQWEDALSPDQPTLGMALAGADWTTQAVVAHSALGPPENGFHHGYDAFDVSAYKPRGYPVDFTTSAELVDAALPRIRRLRRGEDPWLLWVHFFDPHAVYFSHDELLDLGDSDADRYAAEVAFTDQHVGRLLDALSGHPDLVVVFVGDHGEEFGDHGGSGHAQSLYEELVHIPLSIKAPGLAPAVVQDPVGLVDLAPTILDLVDVEPPTTFRGVSLLPAPVVRPILLEARRIWNWRGVIDGTDKFVVDLQQQERALFDLATDPDEQVNQIDDRPEQATHLAELLRATYSELNP